MSRCSERTLSSAVMMTVQWRCVAYKRLMPSACLSRVAGLAMLSMMHAALKTAQHWAQASKFDGPCSCSLTSSDPTNTSPWNLSDRVILSLYGPKSAKPT